MKYMSTNSCPILTLCIVTFLQNLPQGEQANWEQNVNDAIAVFHKLQTGLDVNVRFTG